MRSVRRSSRAATLLVLALLVSACAAPGGGDPVAPPAAPAAAPAADPGAAARQAVLERYESGAPPVTLTTPHIIGRSPAAAERLLQAQGLEMRLVAFDRERPVTAQHPAAGQPVPLDGVIEAWLGEPPEEIEVEVPAPPPPADPAPGPTATPSPAAVAIAPSDPGEGPVAAEEVAASYVLPPHTAGVMRTNPRQLAAVPQGTELTGQASWYGPGFHGLRTACGGIFDQNGATLATRELRCGTIVRITGPTGRTVQATVTDWGPAEWTGRRFDLSAAVFNAIAPVSAGVIPVRIVTANVPQ